MPSAFRIAKLAPMALLPSWADGSFSDQSLRYSVASIILHLLAPYQGGRSARSLGCRPVSTSQMHLLSQESC
jgi:hypothetical protein